MKKKYIIMSIYIVIMIAIGCVIEFNQPELKQDINNRELCRAAAQINSAEEFKEGIENSIGNSYVYGSLEAIDAVSFPELDEEYLYIMRQKQEKSPNAFLGYSWMDTTKEEKWCSKIMFCGVEFSNEQFKSVLPTKYIDTMAEDAYTRYIYYGIPASCGTATMLLNNENTEVTNFYENMSIPEALNITMQLVDTALDFMFYGMLYLIFAGGLGYLLYLYLDEKEASKNVERRML